MVEVEVEGVGTVSVLNENNYSMQQVGVGVREGGSTG